MKKAWTILLTLLLLCALLTGCGSAKSTASAVATTAAAARSEGFYAVGDVKTAAETTAAAAAGTDTAAAPDPTTPDKIIYTASVSLETREFDQSIQALEALIAEQGGYVQSSSVNGSAVYNSDGSTTVENRYANYTAAVPAEKLDAFLQSAGSIGNVVSKGRQAENISSQYTDTQGRIETLQTEKERLLAMMEQTGDMESLIALEQRLSDLTYQIESHQRTLNDWDRQVSYSTVTLSLREVSNYTSVAAANRTFGERLRDAFSDGLSGFGRGMQNFLVFLVSALPVLLLLAAAAVGIVLLVRRGRSRRRPKKEPRQEPPQEPKA